MATVMEWVKNNSSKKFKYVGSIWGEWSGTATKKETIEMVDECGASDEVLVDHPNSDGGRGTGGYYLQSGNLHYYGYLIDEKVLEAL